MLLKKKLVLQSIEGAIWRGRIRAAGRIVRGGREGGLPPCLRCIKLLPLMSVVLIVAALSILAISEMSLMGKRKPSGAYSAHHKHGKSHYKKVSTNKNPNLVFELQPLLKKNAASIELSAIRILNEVRSGIINSYINKESNYRPTKQIIPKKLPACPWVPTELKGELKIPQKKDYSKLYRVKKGGWWMPQNCNARHAVAVIIPYRDRKSQLETLMEHLHPILQRQQVNYRIFLVEQEGNDMFNKGVLMNAGFMTALRKPLRPGVIYHCFVFHDVDMLSEDDRNLYTCPTQPRHMSVAVNELDYTLPYRELVGGVFAIRTDHFLRVNGYSNLYWGWGGEDDDMGYRVEDRFSTISRSPEWIARYSMIKHRKRVPLARRVRVHLIKAWRRYIYDGLNTLQYKLLKYEELHLYTRLLVVVGHPPKIIKKIQKELL